MRTLQIISFSVLVLGFTACQKEVIAPNAAAGDKVSIDYTTNGIQEEQTSDLATPDWAMRTNTEGGSSAGNSSDGGAILNGTITDPNSDEDSEKKKGSN